jgi:hypothetical protein
VILTLLEEEWTPVRDTAWVWAFKINFLNGTADQVILESVSVRPNIGEITHSQILWEVTSIIAAEQARKANIYFDGLFTEPITLAPRISESRWFIGGAYATIPDGGRPQCTCHVRDTWDNTYELEIPARPRQDV